MTTIENERRDDGLRQEAAPPRPNRIGVRGVMVSVTVIPGPVATLVPGIQTARGQSRRAECAHHMRHVRIALHNHAAMFGRFPQATTRDAAGRPVSTWRSDVAPYLPADPANVLACPCEDDPNDAVFRAVVRDDFVWREGGSVAIDDVTDGTSNTIMLVECCGDTGEMPGELTFEAFMERFRARDLSCHPGGFHAAMVDGSTRFLSYDTDPKVLEAMFTIAAED